MGGGGMEPLVFVICLEELWSLQLTSEEKERGQTRRQKMRRFRCCQPPAFKELQFSECLLGPYAFFKVLSGIFLQHVIFLHNLTWAGEVAQPLGVPTVLNQLAQTFLGLRVKLALYTSASILPLCYVLRYQLNTDTWWDWKLPQNKSLSIPVKHHLGKLRQKDSP